MLMAVGITLVAMVGMALLVLKSLVRVRASQALIRHGVGRDHREPQVSFTDTLVLPFQSAELVDLSTHELVVDRRGSAGLRCRDDLRVDVVVRVKLRVNPTAEDVLRAARRLKAENTGVPAVLAHHFEGRFATALATLARACDLQQLLSHRDELSDKVLDVVGTDLDGYAVDSLDVAVLAQTPLEALDPSDVLDAVASRKIAERTGAEKATADALRKGRANESAARESGHRNELAAAESRVAALSEELDDAKRVLEALRR